MVTPGTALTALGAAVVAQRIGELALARRNEAWARAAGAVEHGRGHYWAFFPLHTAWLLGWWVEAGWRGPHLVRLAWPLVLALLFATALRVWAIASLGRRWNTRILVLPGRPPVVRGPYRFLRHPNYVAVALELAAYPLLFGAWITAAAASALNAALLLGVRIPAEDRALGRGPSPAG